MMREKEEGERGIYGIGKYYFKIFSFEESSVLGNIRLGLLF